MRSPSSTGKKWIVCLAAVSQELTGLSRRMQVEESFRLEGARYHKCRFGDKNILLVQTGIGRQAAEKAAGYVLGNHSIGSVISFGFAGGLARHLKVGDLILCRQLFCSGDRKDRAVIGSDPHLISLAIPSGLESQAPILGSSVTVEKIVRLPEEKAALARAYPAEIVEMESFWIGQACAGQGIPFLALRAVTDEAGQQLPPFDRFLSASGQFHWQPALGYFLQKPGEIFKITQFLRDLRLAESRLTAFLSLYLQSLSDA